MAAGADWERGLMGLGWAGLLGFSLGLWLMVACLGGEGRRAWTGRGMLDGCRIPWGAGSTGSEEWLARGVSLGDLDLRF